MALKYKVKCHKNAKSLVESIIYHYLCKQKALNMKYLDRIADRMLQLRLEAFGAVQIVGPK